MAGRRLEAESQIGSTFTGYIENTLDALLIFEACKQRMCSKISRRLHDKERHLIHSGAVFVFQEAEAGIKRWTDGLVWSPSRILGNFLIYRELNKRGSNSGHDAAAEVDMIRHQQLAMHEHDSEMAQARRAKERALVGSLTGSVKYKEGGLVKKTISLAGMHMISYYDVDDVLNGKLRTPSSLPEFAILEPSPDLLQPKMFRQPPLIETGPDGIPRYRAENASAEQLAAQMPMHDGHTSLPAPIGMSTLPSPPMSGGHASTGVSGSPSVSYANERPTLPSLNIGPMNGGAVRARSPIDHEPSRLQRTTSGGAPVSRTLPLTGGAMRFDPYRQPNPKRGNEERPRYAESQKPNSYDSDSSSGPRSAGSTSAFVGHAPVPSYGEDPYRFSAFSSGYSYGGGMYPPHERAYAPLPVPVPHYEHYLPRSAPGYEDGHYWAPHPHQHQHHSHHPAHENGPLDRPPPGNYHYNVHKGGNPEAQAPRQAGAEPHPQSAPAGQTVFNVPSYSGSQQASGMVAASPDDERWIHQH